MVQRQALRRVFIAPVQRVNIRERKAMPHGSHTKVPLPEKGEIYFVDKWCMFGGRFPQSFPCLFEHKH